MAEHSQNLPDWKTRLKAELRRDTKKTVVLMGLLLVAAVVGGRLFIKSFGPDSAGAAVGQNNSGSNAGRAQLASTARVGVVLTDPMSRDAGSERVSNYIPETDPQVDRDIFHCDMAAFRPTEKTRSSQVKPQKAPDEPSEEQLRRARIRAEAASLALQSTITGSSGTAIINGQVVRVGQAIRGFKVIKVSAQSCTLSKDDVDVVLEIKPWRGDQE